MREPRHKRMVLGVGLMIVVNVYGLGLSGWSDHYWPAALICLAIVLGCFFVIRSDVRLMRGLVKLSDEERAEFLSRWSPDQQRDFLKRLKYYES